MKRSAVFALITAIAVGLLPARAEPADVGRYLQRFKKANKDVPELEAHFIDVDYGDSALLKTPGGKFILVDCGPDPSAKAVISYLKDKGVQSIDALVVSHPDADHIRGCSSVLNNFNVEYVYDNGLPDRKKSKTYQNYAAARTKAGHYVVVNQDSTITLEDNVVISFIVPFDNGGYIKESRDNNNSLLLKVTYGNISFLFAGDCESECEQRVLNDNIDSDVLKAAHHGGSTSSSLEFLGRVTPLDVVVSVGTNIHGHPTPEAIERLSSAGAKVFETINGNVVCTTSSRKGLACRYE